MIILKDILMSDNIVESINNNMDTLLSYISEIKPMIGFKHNHPQHHLDVWQHTLYALSLSEVNFDVRLTLLLHDIGKPFSYQDGEVRHFKGHNIVSRNMAFSILNRLNFSKKHIDKICYLIVNHDIPISENDISNNYDLQLLRFEVQRCDSLAHNPDTLSKRIENLNKTKKLFKKNI